MSISSLFEIGKRSLIAHQSAINITSENVANVNTEGFTRRRIDLNSLAYNVHGFASVGFGVSADDVSRVRSQQIQQQLWRANQDLGRYEGGEALLTQVEGIFAETDDFGLSTILSEFWNGWSDLANDPESATARVVARDRGNVLASTVNRIYDDLRNRQEQLGGDIVTRVEDINRLSRELAQVNEQIIVSPSPTLHDQRDLLITNLSQQLNIDVRENEDGTATVTTDGLILVSGVDYNQMSTEISSGEDFYEVSIRFQNLDRSPHIRSGELSAMLETQNTLIPGYIEKLNTFASSLAARVNEVHAGGANLDGITGMNFFEANVNGAADFSVNAAILQDAGLIASRSPGSGPGNNDIAQALSNIRYEKLADGQTASEYYTGILTSVGHKLEEMDFLSSNSDLIVQQLQNQRDSISGVSLDEEMTQLIQYEQAYQAATRVIQTVDEMVQTLLTMV